MDPEQALKRRGNDNSESIVLGIRYIPYVLRAGINAASKSRTIRPSIPKSVLEEIGLESPRVSYSRNVQTPAASSLVKLPWGFVLFVSVGHASASTVSGTPTFT